MVNGDSPTKMVGIPETSRNSPFSENLIGIDWRFRKISKGYPVPKIKTKRSDDTLYLYPQVNGRLSLQYLFASAFVGLHQPRTISTFFVFRECHLDSPFFMDCNFGPSFLIQNAPLTNNIPTTNQPILLKKTSTYWPNQKCPINSFCCSVGQFLSIQFLDLLLSTGPKQQQTAHPRINCSCIRRKTTHHLSISRTRFPEMLEWL